MSEAVPTLFDDVVYWDSLYSKVKQNGKWAVYDCQNKKVLTQFIYDDIDRGSARGRFKVLQNGIWSEINL